MRRATQKCRAAPPIAPPLSKVVNHRTRGPRRWHCGSSRRGRLRNSRSGGPPPANYEARTRPGWGSRGPRPGRASSGSRGVATRGPAPVNEAEKFPRPPDMLGTLLLRGGKPVLPQHRARWLFGEGVGGEETEHGRVITRGPRRWHGGPSRRGRRRNSRSGGPPPANCVARTRPGWGSRGPRPGRASSGSGGEATRGPAPVNGKSRKRESPASAARLGPPMAAGPELPRQPGARSQGQACEIRNGAPLPGSDFGEGARSKWREAAAGDGEGAYTDVRDRAGYGENEAPRRLSPRPTPSIKARSGLGLKGSPARSVRQAGRVAKPLWGPRQSKLAGFAEQPLVVVHLDGVVAAAV